MRIDDFGRGYVQYPCPTWLGSQNAITSYYPLETVQVKYGKGGGYGGQTERPRLQFQV